MKPLALLIVAAVAVSVSAQTVVRSGPGQGRAVMRSSPPPLNLLRNPDVAADVKVTAQQKPKVEALLADADPRSPEKASAAYGKLRGVLNAQQIGRLEQIHRQLAGVRALSYPPYAKLIGASDKQVQELNAVTTEVMGKVMQAQMAAGKAQSEGTERRIRMSAEDMKKIDAELNLRAKKILTAAQWKKWQASMGKPFKSRVR